MALKLRVEIRSATDIVTARQQGRTLARALGFTGADLTLIATAISEVARNILDHARTGEVILSSIQAPPQHGIQIVARDAGPGIPDVAQALHYRYSTERGLGMGLPGVKYLVDEFDIVSEVGKGTTVTMKKWVEWRNRRNNE